MLVCALGDLVLDVVVRLTAAAAEGADTPADIHLGPGGQAANVAAWAAELGASTRLVCKSGADDAGRLAREGLAGRNVEVVGPVEGVTGVVCALVDRDGQRSMATSRGAAATLAADDVDPAWLEGCDHLFVSGYALTTEPSRSAVFRAAGLARETGAAVSVDLSSWSAIRAAGTERFRSDVVALAPEVVFANEAEADAVGEIAGPTWILKRGGGGCSFSGIERAARPVEKVVDTTGAGDALAAGYLVGGPDLALGAAARCVSHLGSLP
jgi:sugar/nucleoside kinase (ribokinase family)